MVDAVAAGVGGMVGMAGALGYGFKMLVDVVGKQLSAQNASIEKLETGISLKLSQHISDCQKCQVAASAAAVASAAATAAAASSQAAALIAAIRKGPVKNE